MISIIGDNNRISKSVINSSWTDSNVINKIQVNGHIYDIGTTACSSEEDNIFNRVMERLSKKPVLHYKCINCGASLAVKYDKPIVQCEYCDTVFVAGVNRSNDTGEIFSV